MKYPIVTLFLLLATSLATPTLNDHIQQTILDTESDPVVQAVTTVPFLLPIPGTLQKASGNVTVTVNSNGTLVIQAITQLFDREPAIYTRRWTFKPHNKPPSAILYHKLQDHHADLRRSVPHHPAAVLGPRVETVAGVTLPIVIPIPDTPLPAKGNTTIGVQLDGKVHIDTVLEATVADGGRRQSTNNDYIGIKIAGSGSVVVEKYGPDGEVCMMPEADIDIGTLINQLFNIHGEQASSTLQSTA